MMQSSHTDVIREVVMVMCYSDSVDNEDNPLMAADEDIDSSDEEQQQPKQQVKTVKPVQSLQVIVMQMRNRKQLRRNQNKVRRVLVKQNGEPYLLNKIMCSL